MRLLPGTMIETQVGDCRQILNPIFLTGGITLSQLSTITGLEPHTVQNWIKRKYIASPVNKKYSQNQLCRIIMINMLKDVFTIDEVCGLFDYLNLPIIKGDGNPIGEDEIYHYFTAILFQINGEIDMFDRTVNEVVNGFEEPQKGCKKRLVELLEIMVSAYLSYSYKQKASLLYRSAIFRGD